MNGAGLFCFGLVVRVAEGKLSERPEVAFDAVHPGGVGGGENKCQAVFAAPYADLFFEMRRKVVEDDIDSFILRI